MLRRVALVKTEVPEESSASTIIIISSQRASIASYC
jgi:hypothetical protein